MKKLSLRFEPVVHQFFLDNFFEKCIVEDFAAMKEDGRSVHELTIALKMAI